MILLLRASALVNHSLLLYMVPHEYPKDSTVDLTLYLDIVLYICNLKAAAIIIKIVMLILNIFSTLLLLLGCIEYNSIRKCNDF